MTGKTVYIVTRGVPPKDIVEVFSTKRQALELIKGTGLVIEERVVDRELNKEFINLPRRRRGYDPNPLPS